VESPHTPSVPDVCVINLENRNWLGLPGNRGWAAPLQSCLVAWKLGALFTSGVLM
jgi:hypothetical protein